MSHIEQYWDVYLYLVLLVGFFVGCYQFLEEDKPGGQAFALGVFWWLLFIPWLLLNLYRGVFVKEDKMRY